MGGGCKIFLNGKGGCLIGEGRGVRFIKNGRKKNELFLIGWGRGDFIETRSSNATIYKDINSVATYN